MAALPTTTTAFASGATEAQFKTFLTGQRDYLAELFGTDGTAATAKSTLGVVAGVSSVNGNTGAITAAQIAAAATSGYGFTPQANLGFTPAASGIGFSWIDRGTFNSVVNAYANWGGGVYSHSGFFVIIGSFSQTINFAGNNFTAHLYQLSKS